MWGRPVKKKCRASPPLTTGRQTPKWNPCEGFGEGFCGPECPGPTSENELDDHERLLPLVVVVLLTEQREECGHLEVIQRQEVLLDLTRCKDAAGFLLPF